MTAALHQEFAIFAITFQHHCPPNSALCVCVFHLCVCVCFFFIWGVGVLGGGGGLQGVVPQVQEDIF